MKRQSTLSRALRRTLLTAAAAACFSVPAHAAEFVNVLTGGTSGVYYPLGVALSQIYGKALPGAKTSVQATKASAENLNLLQAGRGEIAFTLGFEEPTHFNNFFKKRTSQTPTNFRIV